MQLGILDLGPCQGPIANQTVLLKSERVQGVSTLIRAARDDVPQVRDSQRRAEKNHADQKNFYGPWNCQRRGGGCRQDEEIEIALRPDWTAGSAALAGLCGRPFCARYSPGAARWIAWQVHRPFRSRTLLNEFTRPASAIWWSRRSCRVVIHLEHRPCPPRSFRHARRRCFRPARFQSSSRCR